VVAEDELGRIENSEGYDFSGDCEADGEERKVSCTYTGVVQPGDTLILGFPVKVLAGEGATVRNVVRVSGGGALSAAMETPTRVFETAACAKEAAVFGIPAGGTTTALSSVQAGAHPDITTTGGFDTTNAVGASAGAVKNIVDDEPPGFTLDLVNTPACQASLFLREECPVPTQIGVTTQIVLHEGLKHELEPVYNLAPEPGEVAKLGFSFGADFFFEGDVVVRGNDYGLETTFHNAAKGQVQLDNVSLTVWGVPAAAIHDPLRWKEIEHRRAREWLFWCVLGCDGSAVSDEPDGVHGGPVGSGVQGDLVAAAQRKRTSGSDRDGVRPDRGL
jgi:hypothetical protein